MNRARSKSGFNGQQPDLDDHHDHPDLEIRSIKIRRVPWWFWVLVSIAVASGILMLFAALAERIADA